MIPQSVIDNLGLIQSLYQIGASFMNNATIMEWPKAYPDHQVFVSDCGADGTILQGTPRLAIWVRGVKSASFEASPEFLSEPFEDKEAVFMTMIDQMVDDITN